AGRAVALLPEELHGGQHQARARVGRRSIHLNGHSSEGYDDLNDQSSDAARASAARASRRVESRVGSGELPWCMRGGISVHPSTTASQPWRLSPANTCWK